MALLGIGIYVFLHLDIEAYPDPLQPMVEVLTQPQGLSAEEVERIVTIPLEYGLAAMKGLTAMRSISLFGLSDIKCYFSWDTEYFRDKVRTINRLSLITLPLGLTPTISPENPVGEIVRYIVRTPDHDLMMEKEIEDWIAEKRLKTVPGVIDVAGFGGLTKEYHVDVDPFRLNYYEIAPSALISAIQNSNANAGGNYLTIGEQNVDIRSIGFIRNLDDLGSIALAATNATPIRVRDVGDVNLSHAPRLGIVGQNGDDDVTEGIVLLRKHGDTMETVKGVEKKIAELNAPGVLPDNAKIVPFIDRSELVHTTVHTVMENLSVGIILVFLVLFFFLSDLKSALIATVNIPLALCGAFTFMYWGSIPANLISLGAIDFGIIIDSTVIVLENIHRRISFAEKPSADPRALILAASKEVGGPIFFSTLIFIVAFLPLFTMRGVEGAIFSPMSHAYASALATAILLGVTLTPVMSSRAFSRGIEHKTNVLWDKIAKFNHEQIVRVLARPRGTIALIGSLVALALCLFPFLGGQFLPKLEEGNIWARATLPLDSSFENSASIANRARRIFLSFPETTQVVSHVGRPDDGTDATGFFNIEFYVDLKPSSQWPWGMTKDKLVSQMDAKMRESFPGVSFSYSQNIEDNVEEALSGVKGQNSIKIFGPDLRTDEEIAGKVKTVLDGVRGMSDTAVYRSLGQPNLLVVPNRAKCARYGLNVGDVGAVVQAAVGGQAVTQVYEGARSFNLVVRWKPKFRTSIAAIRAIRVSLPGGGNIPLSELADISMSEGASFIYREAMDRYVPVRFSVRDRDLESAVLEAKAKIKKSIVLPHGVSLQWSGEYDELKNAKARLAVIVPISLALIFLILYEATSSLVDTAIVLVQIPVACLGGIVALLATRTPFSVSAAVGFISIFGIAVMDGMLINSYVRQLLAEGRGLVDSIVLGMDRRLRAVLMTTLVDGLGLLPAAVSTKIGAQAQKPLAIVVIGGCLSIILLTRLLQPALIYLAHDRRRGGHQHTT